jgi:iron complex transport system ATP-binding protein
MSISVAGLSFSYGRRPILRDVSFSQNQGELTAVLGPNGAGKTTLFQLILGLRRCRTGEITIDGVSAGALSPRMRARKIAFVPQTSGEAPGYTAFEMALMGTTHALSPFSAPGQREKEAALAALQRLGIRALAGMRFSQLSGGERQLVLIARALAQQAGTLIMDEPAASLDYGNQANILAVLRALAREGYGVLLSTHNPQHALSCADRVLALSGGRVVAYGPPGKVMDANLILRLYGVRVRLVQTEAGPLILP